MKFSSASITGLLVAAFFAVSTNSAAVLPSSTDLSLPNASIQPLDLGLAEEADSSELDLSSFASASGNIDFSPCDSGKQYAIKVQSVSLDPNPPRFNSLLKVTVGGDIQTAINNGATAYAEGKVGLIKFTKVINVCGEAQKNNGISCPIAPSNRQITVGVQLPKVLISVTANLQVKVVNPGNQELFCFKTKVHIKH
ncbi:ML domain-containing protein [Syncephalis fuscata]|nr:ML domain-containing protein [Syncephalis fuscata]